MHVQMDTLGTSLFAINILIVLFMLLVKIGTFFYVKPLYQLRKIYEEPVTVVLGLFHTVFAVITILLYLFVTDVKPLYGVLGVTSLFGLIQLIALIVVIYCDHLQPFLERKHKEIVKRKGGY